MALWLLVILIVFVLAVVLRRLLLRKQRRCPSSEQMDGKTVVITGANSGIGKASAMELARRGARVILACRSLTSAKETAREIQSMTGNSQIVTMELKLDSFESIRLFANRLLENEERIHVLVNNAGVFQIQYAKTENGLEMHMGVNHFGHFLLTSLLIDRIKQSAPSRIINVSSAFSKRGRINFEDINSEKSGGKMMGYQGYADSKLANLLFTRKLSDRLADTGVDVFAVHPGLVTTSISRYVLPRLSMFIIAPILYCLGVRDCDEGCQPIVYCCVAKRFQGRSGLYIWKFCNEHFYPPNALDDGSAQKLWELSERMTGTQ